MLVRIVLSFILPLICFAQTELSYVHYPRKSIELQHPASGQKYQFKADGTKYIKPIGDPIQSNTTGEYIWYREVELVNKDGSPTDGRIYKTSSKWLNKNISLTYPEGQVLIDPETGVAILPEPGLRIVASRKIEGGWNYMTLYFVDSEGNIVDHEGNFEPFDSFKEYKLSQAMFDKYVISGLISSVENVESVLDYTKCDPDAQKIAVVEEEQVAPPLKRPPVKREISTFEDIIGKRRWFLNEYSTQSTCRRALENHQKTRETNLWPREWSQDRRAQELYKNVNSAYSQLLSQSGARVQKGVRTSFADIFDVKIIHPGMSPELMTCIGLQETRGHIDPQRITADEYCNHRYSKPRSKAFGFSAMVGSTISSLKNIKPWDHKDDSFNLLNITLHPDGDKIKTTTDYYHALSDSVVIQMELLFKGLNYKFKQYNQRNDNSLRAVKTAVRRYGDGTDEYVDNVVNKCLPCMKKVKSGQKTPGQCHDLLLE